MRNFGLLIFLVGCTRLNPFWAPISIGNGDDQPPSDLAGLTSPNDLSATEDLSGIDLAGLDLAKRDLPSARDLSTARDLSSARDLSPTSDLAAADLLPDNRTTSDCVKLSNDDCESCCVSIHSAGFAKNNQIIRDCACASLGPCVNACAHDLCATGQINDPNCGACISISSCDPTTQCQADTQCNAWLTCAQSCPSSGSGFPPL